jgi:glyoxylase-like metal-dependent hydrolase (beta-lactamase superfamily II)
LRPILIPAENPGPYTGAGGNNTYLLPGREPTLIDAGVGQPGHLAAIERALDGRDLARVIVTHIHSDHIQGLPALRERWPGLRACKLPWPERDAAYAPDWQALRDDEEVAAGDGQLRVVHTPGHSPDHICLWDAASRTLFGGDLLVQGGTVLIPASSGGRLVAYLAALARVAALSPSRVLPAHGPAIDDPAALIAQYIAHRQDRERQILDVLAHGAATVPTIVSRIYESLLPALEGAAAESVLAHLQKLQAERRVRQHEGTWALR